MSTSNTEVERQICTKENPMPKNEKGFWLHPDALFLYERYTEDENYELHECPHCKLHFSVTIGD